MKNQLKTKRRQTIVEYVLIIAIVVVAAIGILSVFSDTVRGKIAGIIKVLDPNASTSEADTSSKSMQGLTKDGMSNGSSRGSGSGSGG